MSFLDYKNEHYKNNVFDWIYAHDHLTGAVLDELRSGSPRSVEEIFSNNDPGSSNAQFKKGHYLQQRLQGESNEGYRERQAIADYTPLFTHAVVTLAGLCWSNARDKTVTWDESFLGSPTDTDSIMYKLWMDADGKGTNWDSLFKLVTTDIITTKELWTLVEGVKTGDSGEALNAGSLRFILPQDVPDWIEDSMGQYTEVKACSTSDMRTTIQDEPQTTQLYHVFTSEGWITYAKDKGGQPKQLESGTYGAENFRYYTTSDRSTWRERLPIYRKELPVRANIGYIMARKCNGIYNLESARDFQLWAACFPKAMLDVLNEDKTLNEELYDEIKKAIREGSNAWPGNGHEYKGPPVDGADIRNQTLEIKQKQFLRTFFQVAGDQAAQQTATQIKVDFKAGVEAFLGMLATTLDEIENEALFLLEQVNFPNDPSKWGHTKVKRSTDFSNIDIDAEIDRAISRWVPSGTLPATEDMILELTQRAAERDRLTLPEEQTEAIKAQIRQQQDQDTQAGDVFSQLRRRRVA